MFENIKDLAIVGGCFKNPTMTHTLQPMTLTHIKLSVISTHIEK